jgi:hypothetical protein
MADNLKLLRFFFVLLAIFVLGRWALGFAGADYNATHQVFSVVILAVLSSAHHAFIVRRFLSGGVKRAVVVGATIGVVSQVLILLSTVVSYLGGMETFWNNPRALNVPEAIGLGQALQTRLIGLIVNTILNVIASLIGYAAAGAVPKGAR